MNSQRLNDFSGSFIHSSIRLSGGGAELGFHDLIGFFQQILRTFQQAGVSTGDVMWVEARHELAHGVLILHLLEHRYGFVMGRPGSGDEPDVPRFCRWIVAITEFDASAPDMRLELRHNAGFSDSAARQTGGWVFFRTSGSTGSPRLVAHDRGKLLRNAAGCADRFELNESRRVALPVPIWHMFGFGAGFLPGVIAGSTIDLQADSNVLRYQQRETEFAPDVTYLTPAQVNSINRVRKQPRPYRLTIIAGDVLKREAFHRYEELGGAPVQLYGSTELGAVSASSPGDGADERSDTVGTPMPGVECRICPDGETLQCRHPFGFEAYVSLDGDVERQPPASWIDTHDMAELTASGRIRILGRADHRIKRDGILVDLDAVATTVEGVPGIRSCVCIGGRDGARGKEITAFCVRERGANGGPDYIRRHLLRRLARREVPDRIVILPELPLLDNGKIDWQRLAVYADDCHGDEP